LSNELSELNPSGASKGAPVHALLDAYNSRDALQTLKGEIATGEPETIKSLLGKDSLHQPDPNLLDDVRICPTSSEYRSFIETTAHNIYNIKALGNINTLEHKYDCDVKNTADAVKLAQKALDRTRDKYNHILSPNEVAELDNARLGRMIGIGVHLYSKNIGSQNIYIGISAIGGINSNSAGANDSAGLDSRLDNSARNKNALLLNQTATLHKMSALRDSQAKNGTKANSDAPSTVTPTLGVAIEKVTPNTPADRANLKTDDIITAIDGHSVQGKDAFDVAHDLQGAAKTTVELSIVRNGENVNVPIVRDIYDNPDVSEPKDMGNGVTYIRVYSFGSNSTGAQLRDAMNKMPDTKSFVIDVRGNTGGYISSAIDSAELFVKKGTLMTKQERLDSDVTQPIYQDTVYELDDSNLLTSVKTRFNSAISQDLVDNSMQSVPSDGTRPSQRFAYAVGDRPVVLLVNGDSASAAEIFEGAVHDSGNVTTLGTRSFGKGIGQSIFPNMPGGTVLKVTSLEYKTPSGKWPGDGNSHKHGLDPDIPVKNPLGVRFESDQDLQLQAAVKLARQKCGT